MLSPLTKPPELLIGSPSDQLTHGAHRHGASQPVFEALDALVQDLDLLFGTSNHDVLDHDIARFCRGL